MRDIKRAHGRAPLVIYVFLRFRVITAAAPAAAITAASSPASVVSPVFALSAGITVTCAPVVAAAEVVCVSGTVVSEAPEVVSVPGSPVV